MTTTTPTLDDLEALAAWIRIEDDRPCPEDEDPISGPTFKAYLAACDQFEAMADELHRCRTHGCGAPLSGPHARSASQTGYCDDHKVL